MQASLRTAMYEVVRNAFHDCHLPWDDVEKLDRGDGIVMLVPPATDPITLAGPLIRALHDCLREKASFFSAEHQMRLRVALHQGTCHQDTNGWVGEPINTVSRLVDAAPLRAALTAADAATMAVIASDDIYRGVIRQGYRQIDKTRFAPVDIDIKEVHERAWILVPGYRQPPGIEPGSPQGSGSSDRASAAPPAHVRQNKPAGIHFHGPVTFGGGQIIGDKIVHGDETHGGTALR